MIEAVPLLANGLVVRFEDPYSPTVEASTPDGVANL
jgi:hypothetical protein